MKILGDSTAKVHYMSDKSKERLDYVRVFRFDVPDAHEWYDPIQGKFVAFATDGFAMVFYPLDVHPTPNYIEREIWVPAELWKTYHSKDMFFRSLSYKETELYAGGIRVRFVDNYYDLDWKPALPKRQRATFEKGRAGVNIDLLNKIKRATGASILDIEYGDKYEANVFRAPGSHNRSRSYGALMPVVIENIR